MGHQEPRYFASKSSLWLAVNKRSWTRTRSNRNSSKSLWSSPEDPEDPRLRRPQRTQPITRALSAEPSNANSPASTPCSNASSTRKTPSWNPPRHGPESHPKRIHAHLRSQRHAQSRHRAIRRTVRPARHHRRRRYFRRSICRWSGDGGNSGNEHERDLRQRSNSNLKNLMQKMSADMSGMFTVKK